MSPHKRTVITLSLMFIATGAFAQNLRPARYQLIDRDLQSVTTRFADVEVTTLRLPDGRVETRVRTRDGGTSGPFLTERAGVQSLDAVNTDRYRAWKGRRLEARMPDAVESVTSLTSEFEAFSRRGAAAGAYQGEDLPTFTSALRDRRTQELIVVMAWYAGKQELVFHTRWQPHAFAVSHADLPNGWPVTPNMAWANIQMLSFVRSHDDQRRTGKRTGGRFAVATHDDPGCTGLHWLDGGVLRDCCDEHDRCYEWYGCDYRSWWTQGSWSCVQCNAEVVVCFWIRVRICEEIGSCLYIRWQWGGFGYDCFLSGPGYCPAWCRACTY